jgi:hypothetical protein
MTDREPADPLPALYHALLERDARLERLLEQLLEHDRRRERSGRTPYLILTTISGEEIQFTKREAQVLRLLATGAPISRSALTSSSAPSPFGTTSTGSTASSA